MLNFHTMESININKKSIDIIKTLMRDTSQAALVAMSQKKQIAIEDVTDNKKILGHWMALISVSGVQLHLTFKVQFSIEMARSYASEVLKNDRLGISNSHSKDFIRELCNLVAGNLKTKLAENNVTVGISLPLLSRGFDDLFFANSESSVQSIDRWQLVFKETTIYCCSIIEAIEDLSLSDKLNDSVSTSGDVEFF